MPAPSTWHWATTGTRVAPSAGEQDSGYTTNQTPSSSKLNYLLGLAGDWLTYLTAVFAATEQIAALSVAEADVRHGERRVTCGAGMNVSNFTPLEGGWTLAASTAGEVQIPLPLAIGDRLKSISVRCKSAGGASADIVVSLWRVTSTSGAGSSTVTQLASDAATLANTNIQNISVTPTADTVAQDEHFFVKVAGANTAGIKTVYQVQAVLDRVA